MSEIILNWLNDEIQLSKRISNFEEDFHNGYLFGELLSKYNQQLNFPQFLNKDDKKSKIRNFELLFDSFVSLGVPFNSILANDIINKKQGVSKKILYELKMHLEKTNSNAFTKLTKMTKTLSPLKKIKVSKDQYDKVEKEHFVKQLNELRPSQKSVNQESLLRKFSDFHDNQKLKNLKLTEKEQSQYNLEKKKFRDKERDNLKKTTDFRNQWQRSNMEKWSANMTVRKMQHEKDTMYKTKLQDTKFQNKTMSELNALKSLDKDIKEFERKFVKKDKKRAEAEIYSDSSSEQQSNVGGEVGNNVSLTKKQSFKPGISGGLSLSQSQSKEPAATQSLEMSLKKKKAPIVSEQQKHQRQKKRRKMIVEQNKRYQLIEISRREKYILSTIQQTSKQEKELEYQIWRVWQNKQIIKENKAIQQEKEKEKAETKEINRDFKRKELLKTFREEHEKQVADAVARQTKQRKDYEVKCRKEIYSECKNMVESFINVAEKCFLYQQQKNTTELSPQLLDHLFSEFVEDAKSEDEIAQLELSNYINGKGEWNIKVNRAQNQPDDPVEENALPEKVINNYTLGNVLRFLYESKFNGDNGGEGGERGAGDHQGEENEKKVEYLFALLGLEFSGKHQVARALKQRFGFSIIEVEALIMSRITEYMSMKDKVTEVSEDTKQLVTLAYQGKTIPDCLTVRLIAQEVKKNPNSILINYPITYQQSILLTKTLGGIEPSDYVSKSQLHQRIESLCRLIKPTESKTIPRSIRECGVDLTLWIDISPKTSFERFLGRRWLENGEVVHIKDDVVNNVEELVSGEKASAVIMKNHNKMVEKERVEGFFNEFGIEARKVTYEDVEVQVEVKKQEEESNENNDQKEKEAENGKVEDAPLNDKKQQVDPKDAENQVPQAALQQKEQGGSEMPLKKQLEKREKVEHALEKTWKSINGNCSISDLTESVAAVLEKTINTKNFKKQLEFEKKQAAQKQASEKEELLRIEKQMKQKCCLTSPQTIKSKVTEAKDSVKMDRQFVEEVCQLWDRVEESTVSSLTKVFKLFSEQQREKNEYISSMKRNFILLLTRDDNKFCLVKDFQLQYNSFVTENPDMISQQYTKDELHQRVDDLEDELFDCIEQKKQDAIEERKNIIESGWLQSQMEQFHNCAQIMLQTELNRFNASEKIINDFYSKKYSVPQGAYEQTPNEIPYDTSLEMYNKQNNSFPRLEKLISQTLRIFNREEEVVDDKNKKGGKAPPKKDDKKDKKKGEVEEVKEPTPQELEMKKAINIEKSIFRYRVNIINQYCLKKIENTINDSNQLNENTESYYLYTYDIEKKTVLNLSKIFRSKIEGELKIENEVQINYVDVIETELIRNFQKEKPVVLPASEAKQENRFSIANIKETIKFIQNQSQSSVKISTKRLFFLFDHLKSNQTSRELLPEKWADLSQENIEKFIQKLDSINSGSVELWKVFIFIVMSNFLVPTPKEAESYFNELTEYGTGIEVSLEKLKATPAFFDEDYQQIENVRTFERNELIKEVLFDLHREQEAKEDSSEDSSRANAHVLVSNLKLEWLSNVQGEQKTYFEVAFE